MHTFFINTSKKDLNAYDILFDIHKENKDLVSMACPMPDWYDKEKGYAVCLRQMSDMIDGYVGIDNAFDLILYVDLPENEVYSAIERDAYHDQQRLECCTAMRILFTHVVSQSLVKELVESGREPQNILIMFGEEKQFSTLSVPKADANREAVREQLLRFLGLPETDAVETVAKALEGSNAEKTALLQKKISEAYGKEIVSGIRQRYDKDMQLWLEEVVVEANVPKANQALFDRICGINREEADRAGVQMVSCPYDCYACKVNRKMLAQHQMNIAIYVLNCLESGSIYEEDSSGPDRRVRAFYSYSAQQVTAVLAQKAKVYAAAVEQMDTLGIYYPEQNLVPKLMEFDHAKFGLDAFGEKATDLVVIDVTPEEKETSSGEEEPSGEEGSAPEQQQDGVASDAKEKKIEVVDKRGRVLLSRDEFTPFDYTLTKGSDKMLKKGTASVEYVKQAKQVRNHHLSYLKKLKQHVTEVLSNYAGRSKANKPAVLQMGGTRYATTHEEHRVLETVEGVAKTSYETMFNQYMEFCAARSVAITDIEKQSDWFVTRINQLDHSLKKISQVAVGLLAAIFALYLPYVVIQFEAIVENALTFAMALGSVVVPVVLLYLIFTGVALAQRKKYIKAWGDFKDESDKALSENAVAVQKYDQLLSTVIPALRWVYEYKLDVEYCVECCRIADEKLAHHRQKLVARIDALKMILSDLEYRSEGYGSSANAIHSADAIDMNVSFCTGEKNRTFYSVIDKKQLTELRK